MVAQPVVGDGLATRYLGTAYMVAQPGTEMKISTATIYGLPSKMSPIGLLGPSGGNKIMHGSVINI